MISPDRIKVRVWERGAGLTLACGTGACAVAVAAARKGLANRNVTIELPGGPLRIDWRGRDNHILMTGPWALDGEGVLPEEWLQGRRMSVETLTFGCRLNAYESEVMKAEAEKAGLSARADRQHLRGDGRGGAPGQAGDPQGPARRSRPPDHRHRLRRADRARAISPTWPRSISSSATPTR